MIANVIFWAVIIGIVYMLVRPSSKAGQTVIVIADALAGVIATATGAAARAAQGG